MTRCASEILRNMLIKKCGLMPAEKLMAEAYAEVEQEELAWGKEMQSAYQSIISERFSGIQVRVHGDMVEAFFVPDLKGREFMKFVLDELPDILWDEYDLDFTGIIPHGVENTIKYFPALFPNAGLSKA